MEPPAAAFHCLNSLAPFQFYLRVYAALGRTVLGSWNIRNHTESSDALPATQIPPPCLNGQFQREAAETTSTYHVACRFCVSSSHLSTADTHPLSRVSPPPHALFMKDQGAWPRVLGKLVRLSAFSVSEPRSAIRGCCLSVRKVRVGPCVRLNMVIEHSPLSPRETDGTETCSLSHPPSLPYMITSCPGGKCEPGNSQHTPTSAFR